MTSRVPGCSLCESDGGRLLVRTRELRVVLVDDVPQLGFCRVIWNSHVREMTDLATVERHALLDAVLTVERALRDALEPDKINLASLGNQTPHLHWHVIPRFRDDAHFPDAIWTLPRRDVDARADAATVVERVAARVTRAFAS